MKISNPLIAVPVKYGFVGGMLSILVFVLVYQLDRNPLTVYGNFDFSFLLFPIFIAFSLKDFRDNWNDKSMKFWQGMTIGFINYSAIAIISAIFIFLFLTFIDHTLLTEYISDRSLLIVEMKDEMIKTMGQAVYETTYREVQETTAYVIALDDFLKKVFIGLFLTIILSVIFRK